MMVYQSSNGYSPRVVEWPPIIVTAMILNCHLMLNVNLVFLQAIWSKRHFLQPVCSVDNFFLSLYTMYHIMTQKQIPFTILVGKDTFFQDVHVQSIIF